MEDELRAGLFRADLGGDLLHGLRDVRGVGVVRRVVVRADHQDDVLCLVAVQFAVRDAPQDVLRAVAAVAEVQDGAPLRELLPARGMLPLPEVHDGVAQQDEVHRLLRKRLAHQ